MFPYIAGPVPIVVDVFLVFLKLFMRLGLWEFGSLWPAVRL